MAQVRRPTGLEVRASQPVAPLVGAWGRRGTLDLGVGGALGFGGAGGGVTECRHGGGELLERGVHPLEAVAEGEQVGGDGAEVGVLEERVNLAGIHGIGRLGRHWTGDWGERAGRAVGVSLCNPRAATLGCEEAVCAR
jgi:hypothetical protein